MVGTPALRTVKVIVGGEGNVGKTSLIRRYAKAKFTEARNITLGIDITTQEFDLGGERFKLALWDIEGQAGDRPNFYIGAQAALLVYDVTEPRSLELLQSWIERVRRYAPDTPLLIAGNKTDLQAEVPEAWGDTLAEYVGARGHRRMSAKTDTNVTETFRALAEIAVARVLAEDERAGDGGGER
jgi:small GTP-binding protein